MRWRCSKRMVNLLVAATKDKDVRQVPRMGHTSIFIIETQERCRISWWYTISIPASCQPTRNDLDGLQAASRAAICKCLDGPNPSSANGFTHTGTCRKDRGLVRKNWRYLAYEEHNWTLSMLYCQYKYIQVYQKRNAQKYRHGHFVYNQSKSIKHLNKGTFSLSAAWLLPGT